MIHETINTFSSVFQDQCYKNSVEMKINLYATAACDSTIVSYQKAMCCVRVLRGAGPGAVRTDAAGASLSAEPLSVLCHGRYDRDKLLFRYDAGGGSVEATRPCGTGRPPWTCRTCRTRQITKIRTCSRNISDSNVLTDFFWHSRCTTSFIAKPMNGFCYRPVSSTLP